MRPSPKLIAVLRWLLLSLVGPATLLAVFVSVENWRGNRAWRMTADRCVAEGESLDFASLRPARVRDEENFFKAPLLARILYEKAGDQEQAKIISDSRLADFRELPRFGSEFKDLASLRVHLKRKPSLHVPDTGNAAADLLAAMNPLRALLDDMREAGRHRPKAGLDWSNVPLESPRLAIDTIFSLSMALGFRARIEVELGQIDEAHADILALQRMGNGLASSPAYLLHLLVGVAMHGAAADVITEGCHRHVWSEAQLRQCQILLNELGPLAGFSDAIRRERASVVYLVDNPPKDPAFGMDWPWWLFPGWVQQNKVAYCRTLEERILARVRPATNRILADTNPTSRIPTDRNATSYSPYQWLTQLCLANLEGILDNFGTAAEQLNLKNVGCALERYRLARGAYPEELSTLVPVFLPQRPNGILNGIPISLQKTTDGKLGISSAGWNARDDRGAKDDVVLNFGR